MTPVKRSQDLEAIAAEAYLYLFPLVLMDVTRRITANVPTGVRPGMGPMNRFTHLRAFPPGDFREVVRPNFDTLYSVLWFDLRDEPVIVTTPDTGGRYYMLPMMDMWTDVFAVVGSRTTGTGEGDYALVPPGWDGSLPEGVDRIDAPTPMGWIIGRTQTNGPDDYGAVHVVQDGFGAVPLSQWPGPARVDDAVVDPSIDMTAAPLDQVLALSGIDFFVHATRLMTTHRPHLVDQPILARMTRLGLHPDRALEPGDLDDDQRGAIDRAPLAAQDRMTDTEPRLDARVDGWSMPTSQMGVYGTNYLRRAVVAKIGLGANLAEDAIYPVVYSDDHGEPPDGAHDYVLHFEADRLPPADAFWSVTMYDAEGFTVPNPLDRYALGDRDPLRYGDDGSLDLYLQHTDPGGDRTPNWLPAPDGPLGVTLRIYGPRPPVLDGRWTPPPLHRT